MVVETEKDRIKVLESKISEVLVIDLMYRQKEETRTTLRLSKND